MCTRRDIVVGVAAASLAVAATLGAFALLQSVRGDRGSTMNPGDRVDADLVTLPSALSAAETVERLKALLTQKGIELFAHIDHEAGARTVGLTVNFSGKVQVLLVIEYDDRPQAYE